MRNRNIILLIVLFIILLIGYFIINNSQTTNQLPSNNLNPEQVKNNNSTPSVSTIVENLDVPWSFEFLPDGNIILTERPGSVEIINIETGEQKNILTLNDVAHIGEGGLLGVTLHPDFATNNYIYLYYTYRNQGNILNQVVRYNLQSDNLIDRKVIIDNIPGGTNHDGGRIKFGPDNYLYITTGDAGNSQNSQNRNSLSGKIIRLKDDGSIPNDNPFNNSPIFSYGHRNSQGLAWDSNGNLWATEHGPSARDELNLIKKGANYGWPIILGNEKQNGLEVPILNSGSDTWAPSGLAYLNNSLYFTGLRGQGLYKVTSLNNNPQIKQYFKNEFGRIRDIIVGPDQMLYILTNNTDGRGIPKKNDDKIIRINPSLLN